MHSHANLCVWKGQPDWLVQEPLQLPMADDAKLPMISLSTSWKFSSGSNLRFSHKLFRAMAGLISLVWKLLTVWK